MQEKKKVGILIRTLNEAAHLPKLISGLRRQTFQPHEIIVVDSGSTDGTQELAKNLGCVLVELQPEDFSYGRALNLGFKELHSDLVIVVSAHVFPVYQDYLSNLIKPFEDPRCGLVYGRQVAGETTKLSEAILLESWFPGGELTWQKHAFANNANSAIRRVAWELFGFDEVLPALEDIDFARRIRAAGWKVAYQPAAEVVHLHDETFKSVFQRYRREAAALKQIYPSTRFNRRIAARIFLRNLFHDCRAAWGQGLPELIKAAKFRYFQVMGFYKGFFSSPDEVHAVIQRYFYGETPSKTDPQVLNNRAYVDYSAD